jgi:hypothetical protein
MVSAPERGRSAPRTDQIISPSSATSASSVPATVIASSHCLVCWRDAPVRCCTWARVSGTRERSQIASTRASKSFCFIARAGV